MIKYKILSNDDMDYLYWEFLNKHVNDREQIKEINKSLAGFDGWDPSDLYYATRDAYMETLVIFGDVRKDLFNNYIIVRD